MIPFAADAISDTSTVTISLPWIIWTAMGGTILGAFTWLARLTIKGQNDSKESNEKMHSEVVALTKEVVAAVTQNTAALQQITKDK